MLKGKRILLGVTGSIAAYKAANIIRLLKKEGAEVQVLMTKSATEFIAPLTLSTLSENPVYTEFVKNHQSGEWTNHVDLGLWADLMVIAPASANTMGKMVGGIADNLLLGVYLSARCPVMVAPAMDLDMFAHPSTQANLETLSQRGNLILPVGEGELASGLVGKGRMIEPEEIVELIANHFQEKKELTGKKVVITSGPTFEPIDPVRFIGNHSSGKMGAALAEVALNKGAEVTVVSGPVHVKYASKANVVNINTAEEMLLAVGQEYSTADILIFAAAVADYTPSEVSDVKIKKTEDDLRIELKKTTDLAAFFGKKKNHQIHVGFALETDHERENALKKLNNKNFNFIVLNSMQNEGAGFGFDTNKVSILDNEGNEFDFSLKSKMEVAEDIINQIVRIL